MECCLEGSVVGLRDARAERVCVEDDGRGLRQRDNGRSPRAEVHAGTGRMAPGRAHQHGDRVEVLPIRRAWGATPRRFKGCCIQQEARQSGPPTDAQFLCTASVPTTQSPRRLGCERRSNRRRLDRLWRQRPNPRRIGLRTCRAVSDLERFGTPGARHSAPRDLDGAQGCRRRPAVDEATNNAAHAPAWFFSVRFARRSERRSGKPSATDSPLRIRPV